MWARFMISNWSNLVARRDLLRELVLSELRTSTAQTRLGWLWWMLDPLLMMLVYWLIVVGLLGRGREQYTPYWLFIFFGLITWKHFASSVSRAAAVLSRKQGLIRAVPIPTMIFPLSGVVSGFFFFLCGFLVLILMALLAGLPQHSGDFLPVIQVPLLMILQIIIVAGIALPLSCWGVLYRDLGELIPHVLKAAFYLTPGLYGVDLVQDVAVRKFGETTGNVVTTGFMLNPFAGLITGYRDAIFYGRFMESTYWIILVVEAALIFIPGYLIYQHYDRRVVKFL